MPPSPSLPLKQSAEDLRLAADLVLRHGKADGEYVAPDGSMCAAGAIGIATGWMTKFHDPLHNAWDFRNPPPSEDDPTLERYLSAMAALSPLLPIDCGGVCEETGYWHTRLPYRNNPNERVFHYNDFICAGGDELASVLTEAAEKIEADLP